MTFSKILEKDVSKDIGLQFDISLLLPFLILDLFERLLVMQEMCLWTMTCFTHK
jgi:hypothetical protein